uniref:Transposon protein, putative, unclassified n=1 Tax=Oryza sativa subsp. japonica TaxID=39947 RepID=Q2QU93_ORYSJ|nr:transposon protein, putative, unclassified [Oryza sativa Japonica Group]
MWNGWLGTSWDPGSGCQFGLNHRRPWVKAGEITRRMDTLDVQTGEIQYNLTEHISQTLELQQSANAQFANFNKMMQQQHDDLQAYFLFQGFNHYQGP